MAGEFDKFLASLTGGAMQPPASPFPAPQPISPTMGMPNDLVDKIMAATSMAAPRRFEPAPQIPVNPMAFASTQPMIAPQQSAPAPSVAVPSPVLPAMLKHEEAYGAAKEGEGYVIVSYETSDGPKTIFVPESYAENLPEGARLVAEGKLDPNNPAQAGQIERARESGVLLEQQPPEVAMAFRSGESGSEKFDRYREENAQEISRGVDPVTVGVMSDEQAAGNRYQSAYVYTIDDVRAAAEAAEDEDTANELLAHADLMERAGVTELRSDQAIVSNGDGTFRVEQVNEQEEWQPERGTFGTANAEPVGTALPALTVKDLREMGGHEAVANEMEANSIYRIDDGKMLVRGSDGKLSVIDAAETAPEGFEIVLYGGKSRETYAPGGTGLGATFDSMMESASPWLAPIGEALSVTDKPRQSSVTQRGESAYRYVTRDPDDPASQAPSDYDGAKNAVDAWERMGREGTPVGVGEDEFSLWVVQNPDLVKEYYESGYVSPETGERFTGGRGVWEGFIGTQPWGYRLASEVMDDPLNALFTGGGILRGGSKALLKKVAGEGAEHSLTRRLAARGLDVTGRALQAPDMLADRAVYGMLDLAKRGMTTAPGVVGRASRHLLSPSRRTVMGNLRADAIEGVEEALSLKRRDALPGEPQQLPARNRGGDFVDATGDTRVMVGRPDGEIEVFPRDRPYAPGVPSSESTRMTDEMVRRSQDNIGMPPREQMIDTSSRRAGGEWQPRTEAEEKAVQLSVDEPITGDVESPFEGLSVDRDVESWDFASPLDANQMPEWEMRRIIDTIRQDASVTDAQWAEFVHLHNPSVKKFVDGEFELQQRSIRNKATREGWDNTGSYVSAVNEARYIVDELIPDYMRVFPDKPIPEYRPRPDRWARDVNMKPIIPHPKHGGLGKRGYQKFNDAQLVEAFVLGGTDQSDAAWRQLRYRAGGRGKRGTAAHNRTMLQSENTLQRLRRDYLDQLEGRYVPRNKDVPPPPAAPAAKVASDAVQPVPAPASTAEPGVRPHYRADGVPTGTYDVDLNRIKSTAEMPQEALDRAGLPRLQPRDAEASSKQVEQIIREGWQPAKEEPILLVRWSDGNLYTVAGHSRVGAARGLGKDSIPARIIDTNDPQELVRLSRETNTKAATFTPREQARIVADEFAAGKSADEIAKTHRLGSDATGKVGTNVAHQYRLMDKIPESEKKLWEWISDGQVSPDIAGHIGRGYEAGVLKDGDGYRIGRNITRGEWEPNDVAATINRLSTRRNAPPQASLFGESSGVLPGMEGMVADDFSQAMAEVVADTSLRRNLLAKLDNIVGADRVRPSRSGVGRWDTRGIAPEQRVEFSNTVNSLHEVNARLGIREEEAFKISAVTNADAGSYYDDMGRSRGLGIIADPEADAAELYNRTLGKQVPNEYAPQPATSEFIGMDDTPFESFLGRPVRGDKTRKMLRYQFNDGETFADKWLKHVDELEAQGMVRDEAERLGGLRAADDMAEDTLKRKWPKQFDYYEQELEKLRALTGDRAMDPDVARIKAMDRAISHTGGTGLLAVYDQALGVLRETTLYSVLTGWRYIATQAIGNSLTALLTNNADLIGMAFNPRNYRASYRKLSGNADTWLDRGLSRLVGDDKSIRQMREALSEPITAEKFAKDIRDMGELPANVTHGVHEEILAAHGIGSARHDVSRVVRDQIAESNQGFTKMHNLADRLRLGRMRVPGKATAPFASRTVRDSANAFDQVFREVHHAKVMYESSLNARPAMRRHLVDNLHAGMDADDVLARFDKMVADNPLGFGSDHIRDLYDDLNPRFAERMARDWQEGVNKMDRFARDEVHRVFFSGDQTNLDEYLGRVVFFHYWMSRATPLYTAAMIRNPIIGYNYFKMMDEMREQAESGKYGQSVDDFLKVFGTVGGFNIFIRPDAYFQTVLALAQGDDFDPENESGLYHFLRKQPFFVNPLLASAGNMLGLAGDTFAPDPFMLGNWSNMITNVLNWTNAHSGREPSRNAYQDLMSMGRDWVSGTASKFIPGSSHILHKDSSLYARRDINYLIQDIAIERGIDTNSPEVLAAYDDPESWLYQEAFRRYANGKMLEQGARILPVTAIFYPKLRVARGDEVRENIASSRRGSDEQADWRFQRQMAQTTDPTARQLILQGDEYYKIGTERQRRTYAIYNSIRFGGVDGSVMIDGKLHTELDLAAMEDRGAAADRWAEQNGYTDDIEYVRTERRAFEERNPEWAAYLTWSRDMRNSDDGRSPEDKWKDITEGNPNAERWYRRKMKDFDDGGSRVGGSNRVDAVLTSPEAYRAVMGIQGSIYEPVPISTNNGKAEPYTGMSTGGSESSRGSRSSSRPTAQGVRDDIAKYQQEMAAFEAEHGVNIDGLNPMARRATLSNMKRDGIEIPSMGRWGRMYLEWLEAVGPNADDVSPEAFIKWLESQP